MGCCAASQIMHTYMYTQMHAHALIQSIHVQRSHLWSEGMELLNMLIWGPILRDSEYIWALAQDLHVIISFWNGVGAGGVGTSFRKLLQQAK